MRLGRRAALAAMALAAPARAAAPLRPHRPEEPEGAALVARLRRGGLTLFFRHADTAGEPCERGFRLEDRALQRHLSADGRAQAAAIGARLAALGVPVAVPVLTSAVFRARDTAEIAFGADRVRVSDALLAHDYAGPEQLPAVLEALRGLLATPVPPGANRVLVGHHRPALLVLGGVVGGRAFPEGAALVLDGLMVLGVLDPAPAPSGGFVICSQRPGAGAPAGGQGAARR